MFDGCSHFNQNPIGGGVDVAGPLARREEVAVHHVGALLRLLADEKKLEVAGSQARLPKHIATDNPADQKMWETVRPAMEAAGFNVPPVKDLAPLTKLKEVMLKDFLHRKAKTGEVIRVTPERFYPRTTLAQLAACAADVAKNAAGNQFTAAQYRDRTGVGRGLAIEILECLDRLGITQRIGDVRKMRKDFVPILGAATAPPPAISTVCPSTSAGALSRRSCSQRCSRCAIRRCGNARARNSRPAMASPWKSLNPGVSSRFTLAPFHSAKAQPRARVAMARSGRRFIDVFLF